MYQMFVLFSNIILTLYNSKQSEPNLKMRLTITWVYKKYNFKS